MDNSEIIIMQLTMEDDEMLKAVSAEKLFAMLLKGLNEEDTSKLLHQLSAEESAVQYALGQVAPGRPVFIYLNLADPVSREAANAREDTLLEDQMPGPEYNDAVMRDGDIASDDEVY